MTESAGRFTGLRLIGFATSIGMVFGFVEAGQAVVSFLVPGALDWRTATGYPIIWVAPLFYGAAFAVVGAMAALGAMLLPRLPWDTVLLAGLALLSGWLAAQLHPTLFSSLTSLILGLGLAAVLVRGYRSRRVRWFSGSIRLLPLLVGLTIVCGVGLWLATALYERSRLAALPAVAADRPNLILLVIDTQRADHLSLYGYSRPTSPNLDRFAAQSLTFDNATASAPWTLPSHATMMTGHPLSAHRAGVAKRPFLDGRFTTIAEALGESGYATGGFIANVFWCGRRTGLDRGFVHYEDYFGHPGDAIARTVLGRWLAYHVLPALGRREIPGRKSAADVNRSMLKWIDGLKGRPFFVFANYLDVHKPFRPPAPYLGRFSGTTRLSRAPREPMIDIGAQGAELRTESQEEIQRDIDGYDESILYLDAQLGEFFTALAQRGLLDKSLVIVTSDHGEAFGDHGLFSHGNSLYRDQISIPLVLHWPGHVETTRLHHPVGLDQIAPTLAQAGRLAAGRFPSRSLLEPPDSGAAAMSQVAGRTGLPPELPVSKGWLAALVTDRFHFIQSEAGTSELFDFVSDPREDHNLASDSSFSGTLKTLGDRLRQLMPGPIR
ncbi:MAG TPA: sulfatase [Gemmatimonadales bacterium]|nr:sulfatase [Gemmatimonadales bacterium]